MCVVVGVNEDGSGFILLGIYYIIWLHQIRNQKSIGGNYYIIFRLISAEAVRI